MIVLPSAAIEGTLARELGIVQQQLKVRASAALSMVPGAGRSSIGVDTTTPVTALVGQIGSRLCVLASRLQCRACGPC